MTIKALSLSQNRRLTAQGADFEPFASINTTEGTVQMDAITKDEIAEAVEHIKNARILLLRAASATMRGLSDDLEHTQTTLSELLRHWK